MQDLQGYEGPRMSRHPLHHIKNYYPHRVLASSTCSCWQPQKNASKYMRSINPWTCSIIIFVVAVLALQSLLEGLVRFQVLYYQCCQRALQ